MAVYRQVHITFWQDDFVLDLTPEEKYFYLFLMTNSKTTGYGIYEIPKRIMVLETGYNSETIDKLISKFIGYKKIEYDETTKEIFIVNWIKYNPINNRNIYVYVVNEIPKIKSKIILSSFAKILKGYVGKWKGKLNKDDNEDTDYIKSLLGLIAPSRGLVPPSKKRERERNPERKENPEPEQFSFESFWNLYDKKESRKQCEVLWTKLPDDIKEKIMIHVPKYVQSKPDKTYRKNPDTYLRNECWNDEIIFPSSKKSTAPSTTETGRTFAP